jgi:hypothetical protein
MKNRKELNYRNNKMAEITTYLLILTLNVHGLISSKQTTANNGEDVRRKRNLPKLLLGM